MRHYRLKQTVAGIGTVGALAIVYWWRSQQPWTTTENALGQTIEVMQTAVPWWHQALLMVAVVGLGYILYLDVSPKTNKEEA